MSLFSKPNKTLLSIICMSTAVILYILVNFYVVKIDDTFSALELFAIQNAIGLFILGLIFILKLPFKNTPSMLKTKQFKFHVLHASLATAGMISLYHSLDLYQDVPTVMALILTGPLFAVIGAKFILKENVTWGRFWITCLGFFGVMIILRPMGLSLTLASLLPILAAVGFSKACLTVRFLSYQDSALIILSYLMIFMTFYTAPFLMSTQFEWDQILPLKQELTLISLMSLIAHFCIILSYKMSEASFIGFFKFFKYPFSVTLAYFYFNEVPKLSTFIGALIIIISGFLITLTVKNNQID